MSWQWVTLILGVLFMFVLDHGIRVFAIRTAIKAKLEFENASPDEQR